jgi:hypothetical protein
MSENITALVKETAALARDNLRQFFRILATPASFISSIEHASSDQLVPASIFAALMSLLNLVLHLPLLRMLGVETESASYLLADTILTYAFWFIYGSCFHFAAKIVGGHGNYTSSLVSFLYLTAFMPVITTILIPVDVIVRRHIVHTADTTSPGFLQFVAADLLASTPALISLTIGLVASIWYLAALSRVFRLVHGVGRVRGVAIVIIGMGIWQILSWFIEIPAFQLFYKAYQTHGA